MLCGLTGTSRSGFKTWEARESGKPSEDELLIIDIFRKSRSKKGYRRLKMAFERQTGRRINLKKIRRIKRKFELVTVIRRKNKFRAVFKAGEESKVAPNLVRRNFKTRKDIVLTTDITELKFAYGQKAYLSAVKDLRTKEIVSYDLQTRPTIKLAMSRLPDVLAQKSSSTRKKIIIHSDQGFQYSSHQFRETFENLGVRLSMSRKGNCLDNAPIESFFGHLKDETDYKSCKSFVELKKCIRNYMEYYNKSRPQWTLKRKTPAEAGVHVSLVL